MLLPFVITTSFHSILERDLPVEDDQLNLRSRQFSDTDRITPKDVGRNFGWIIAGMENHDLSARELLQQILKIAISRD